MKYVAISRGTTINHVNIIEKRTDQDTDTDTDDEQSRSILSATSNELELDLEVDATKVKVGTYGKHKSPVEDTVESRIDDWREQQKKAKLIQVISKKGRDSNDGVVFDK
jgi:hypothetical protein